jgi:hypothetical protein
MSEKSASELDQVKSESKQAEAEDGNGGASVLDSGDVAAAQNAGEAEAKAETAIAEKAADKD